MQRTRVQEINKLRSDFQLAGVLLEESLNTLSDLRLAERIAYNSCDGINIAQVLDAQLAVAKQERIANKRRQEWDRLDCELTKRQNDFEKFGA